MNNQRLYGSDGSFGGNGINLPEKYNVPPGSRNFYGKQESLLNKLDNPTRVNNFLGYNFPSPYQNPSLNYGVGPQAANVTEEVLSAPDSQAFLQSPILRAPTKENPFMNVMPLDYDAPPLFEDYNRYEKSTYPSNKDLEIRSQLKNDFEDNLYQNADSLFWNRLNSQRQYISQPVGSVPNDQNEFSNWLYSVPNNCKAGSIYMNYGVQYTDDSLLCTGWSLPIMSNKGLLNGNLMSSVDGGS